MEDKQGNTKGTPFQPTDGGDEPQSETRSDAGVEQSEKGPATNDPVKGEAIDK